MIWIAPSGKDTESAALETGRLCRLNLAVHGLEGEIKHGGNLKELRKQS